MKPVVLIPVYRHAQALLRTIERLEPYRIPILVVDDGNSPPLAVANHFSVRLPCNRGKGAAIAMGLQKASDLGFSHALQIDADGQHSLEDAWGLLRLAEANPDHLVTSFPVYDATAPAHRVKARALTRFFIRLECGLAREDGMCGCRVYPVGQSLGVCKRVRAMRMGFDVEFIVRWKWAGYEVDSAPVKVTYPTDGVSNFRLFRDNLGFSLMHTRLCLRRISGLYRMEQVR